MTSNLCRQKSNAKKLLGGPKKIEQNFKFQFWLFGSYYPAFV